MRSAKKLNHFQLSSGKIEKVSETNVHLEGADLAIILRQLIENSEVGVRSGTSFQVGSTVKGEVMAASINEETRNPPNNGEECPGQVDNDFNREVFIEEIGNLPCLWNTSIADYRDRERLLIAAIILSPLYLRHMICAQNRKKEFLSARKIPPSGKQPLDLYHLTEK